MNRERDRFLTVVLLGAIVAGLFALVVMVPLATEIRQSLMVVVGMLLVAAFSALSTSVEAGRILRVAALPASERHPRFPDAARGAESGSPAVQDFRWQTAEGDLESSLRRLAAAHGLTVDGPPMPPVALAARLWERCVIPEATFRAVIDLTEAGARLAVDRATEPETVDALLARFRTVVADLDDAASAHTPHPTKVTS